MRQVSVRQQIEDFIGARAADDAVGVEPKGAADRLTQDASGAFRIVLKMGRRLLVGRDRLRRRAERRLIGREFEHLAAWLRHRALAGRVERNIENAGIRHGAVHVQLRWERGGFYGLWSPDASPGPRNVWRGCRPRPLSAERLRPLSGPA